MVKKTLQYTYSYILNKNNFKYLYYNIIVFLFFATSCFHCTKHLEANMNCFLSSLLWQL